MVTFTCNACGDSVKKDKVDTHYRTKCPECNVLSCIDCGKDFAGEGYRAHNSCISEAEKYQGALYKPKDKANKGDIKQQQWLTNVHLAKATIKDPKMKSALDKISKYQNVPRKQKKFINFAKNSLKIYDEAFLGVCVSTIRTSQHCSVLCACMLRFQHVSYSSAIVHMSTTCSVVA
eukprot:m.160701 g.160701  ORF g.160701 m.160701 type:complete len:176 (-) comp18036_c0_seq2:6-533(-)